MSTSFLILLSFIIRIGVKIFLKDTSPNVSVLVVQIFAIGIPTFAYLFLNKISEPNDAVFSKNTRVLDVIFSSITVVSMNILVRCVNSFFTEHLGIIQQSKGIQINSFYDFIINMFAFCIIPAIFEELMFRGILLKSLHNRYSSKTAIIISSIVFSFFHLEPSNILLHIILGIILSEVTISTNSIIVPIFSHFFNNALALGLNTTNIFETHQTMVLFVCLCLAICGAVYFKKRKATS